VLISEGIRITRNVFVGLYGGLVSAVVSHYFYMEILQWKNV